MESVVGWQLAAKVLLYILSSNKVMMQADEWKYFKAFICINIRVVFKNVTVGLILCLSASPSPSKASFASIR
jgi:hypothetical protein